MVYVALLRGINVGGNNKVNMKELKAVFETVGMTSVRTYINSGNVIFESTSRSRAKLSGLLHDAIEKEFGLDISVLVRSVDQVRSIVKALPDTWVNDSTMKCDVVFLSDDLDRPSILEQFPPKREFEDALYTPGAVIWRIDHENATRNSLIKIVGTPLYQQVTVRNCNTARKLLALMEE